MSDKKRKLTYDESVKTLTRLEQDILECVTYRSKISIEEIACWDSIRARFPVYPDEQGRLKDVCQPIVRTAIKNLIKMGFLQDTVCGVRIPTIDDVDGLADK